MRIPPLAAALLAAVAGSAAPAAPGPAAESPVLAVRAGRIHFADGRTVIDAVILVREGRVAAVGPGIPVPRGARVLDAAVVSPGFADLSTGLAGGEDAEDPRPFGASLRIVDGFDPADPAAAAAAREGVLRRLLLPSDRNPAGGAAAVLRPCDASGRLAAVVPAAGGTLSLTAAAARRDRHPGSFAGLLRALEAAFAGIPGAPAGPFTGADAGLGLTPADTAALAGLVGGAAPTFLRAGSRAEVRAALALAARHSLRPVLVEPRCGAPAILEAAASAGIPPGDLAVVLSLDAGDPEVHLAAAAGLVAAGVRVGFGSGADRGPDGLRFMAALARRHGLGREEARAALLGAGLPFLGRSPAGIAEGDPADLVLLDGDPADPSAPILSVVAGGAVLRGEGRR